MASPVRDVRAVPKSQKAVTTTKARISTLDFIKGVLVLTMILYHWMNYFIRADYVYRYLRFLTPSFIFITGFLITNVYLAKYDVRDPRLWRRLVYRGVKTFAIFLVLNICRSLVVNHSLEPLLTQSLAATYLTGNLVLQGSLKTAAFVVLVPISYLLLLSSLLMVAARYYEHVIHLAWLVLFLSVIALGLAGRTIGYLELLSIGLLGESLGYVSIGKIGAFVRHRVVVVSAYLSYIAVLSFWGEVYLLQVIGVCLTLMLIYLLHGESDEPGRIRQAIALLGRYSLVGYIGQIAVLQLLHRGLYHVIPGDGILVMVLCVAIALTMLVVWAVDRARARVPTVNTLYAAVFS